MQRMASSKVMTPPNRSSPRQPSPPRLYLYSDQSRNLGSMNIDDMFRSIYSDSESLGHRSRAAEELWSDVVGEPAMTLEDFLTKAGAVNEGDLEVPPSVTVTGVPVGGGGGGRKRTAVLKELAVEKATQKKQRRMIKNRESAARSRERKQAYTVVLESTVTQLEEDNARLLNEEAALNKERYKQLMENIIPVVESPRPRRVIKRVRSMEW